MLNRKFLLFVCLVLCASCLLTGCPAEDLPDTAPTGTPGPTQTNPTEPEVFTPPDWNTLYTVVDYDQSHAMIGKYGEEPQSGALYMSEHLYMYLSSGDLEDQLFGIMVYELTGAPTEEIYENVIKPLGIQENYLEARTIFVTQDQLAAISWPEEYTILLIKWTSPDAFEITADNLTNCDIPLIPVQIQLTFPVEVTQSDRDETWKDIVMDYFVVVDVPENTSYFAPDHSVGLANVSPEILLQMLEDDRIGSIIHQSSIFEEYLFDLN